jgi:hypothetical protein
MKVSLDWSVELADGTEVDYEIDVEVTAGSPGRMYMPNGDPGYPDEPGEQEILSIKLAPIGKQPGIEIKAVLWEACGFTDAVIERIYEKAVEWACDRSRNDDPPDPRED